MIYSVIDLIDKKLLLSCHDISDGGFITAISEMVLGGEADGKIGAEIGISNMGNSRADKLLFSESSGFLFEINKKNINKIKPVLKKYQLKENKDYFIVGKTTNDDKLIINNENKKMINLKIADLRKAWTTGFIEAMK